MDLVPDGARGIWAPAEAVTVQQGGVVLFEKRQPESWFGQVLLKAGPETFSLPVGLVVRTAGKRAGVAQFEYLHGRRL